MSHILPTACYHLVGAFHPELVVDAPFTTHVSFVAINTAVVGLSPNAHTYCAVCAVRAAMLVSSHRSPPRD